MTEIEITKEKVFSNTTKEYQSTTAISKKVGVHWYIAKVVLEMLHKDGMVEKIKLGRTLWWKKNEKKIIEINKEPTIIINEKKLLKDSEQELNILSDI